MLMKVVQMRIVEKRVLNNGNMEKTRAREKSGSDTSDNLDDS